MKHRDVVKMMGDSWHSGVQGRFLMCWLSVLQERTYAPPTFLPLPPIDEEEDDVDASQRSVMTISVSSSDGD